ncbi:hypothetical protein FLK61_37255 [Paenalkalicoccus suaedae]|uniref:Uncharacterized protein n=1 Tax=Paenalkalicoccus suaedae TaxID=2592382 RepID=A0A859FIW9_9BACI|nr:hypothetical protein [Paenalkalicoccus suaedae]QKS72286.1 hypothetical protein FLK61_37255 [Paenalkalicoccus suaedae]
MKILISVALIIISFCITHRVGENAVRLLREKNINKEVSWFAYAFSFFILFLILEASDRYIDLHITFFKQVVGLVTCLMISYLSLLLILKKLNHKWYRRMVKELENHDKNI